MASSEQTDGVATAAAADPREVCAELLRNPTQWRRLLPAHPYPIDASKPVVPVVTTLKPQLESLAVEHPMLAVEAMVDLTEWILKAMPDYSKFDFWNFSVQHYDVVFAMWQGIAISIGPSDQFSDACAKLRTTIRKIFVLPQMDTMSLDLTTYASHSSVESWTSVFHSRQSGEVGRYVWTSLFHLQHRGAFPLMQDVLSGAASSASNPMLLKLSVSNSAFQLDHVFGMHVRLLLDQNKYLEAFRVGKALGRPSWSFSVLHKMVTRRHSNLEVFLEAIALGCDTLGSFNVDEKRVIQTEDLLFDCFELPKGKMPQQTLVTTAAKLIARQLALLEPAEQAEWLQPVGQPALGFVCYTMFVLRCVHMRNRTLIDVYRALVKRGDDELAAEAAVALLQANFMYSGLDSGDLVNLAHRQGRASSIAQLVPTTLEAAVELLDVLRRKGLADEARAVGRNMLPSCQNRAPDGTLVRTRMHLNEHSRTVVQFLKAYLPLVSERPDILDALPMLRFIPEYEGTGMLQLARTPRRPLILIYCLFAWPHPLGSCPERYREVYESLAAMHDIMEPEKFFAFLREQFPDAVPVINALALLSRPSVSREDVITLDGIVRRIEPRSHALLHGAFCAVALQVDKAPGLRSVLQGISENVEAQIKPLTDGQLPDGWGYFLDDMKKLQPWTAERTEFLAGVSSKLTHCDRCGWSFAVKCPLSKRRVGKHEPWGSRALGCWDWDEY
eukprot:TRINITY_DN7442_c0_g1_i1.p1 TRINITY_DN7442_c0_g1~~TRINITY_DN7442_c0_g1_i1.p1  ORF type:complete len:727 (-),score=127.90 TRINITY_DN7442_c0_g1_i1:200-2380(-)